MMHENEASREDRPRTLQSLAASIGGRGDKPAVEVLRRSGVESCSYDELGDNAEQFARCLMMRGLQRSDTVGIVARPSAAWIASCVGVIRAGAIVVPVDTQLTDAILEHIIRDSAARFIVTTNQFVERLRKIQPLPESSLILLDADARDPRHWLQKGGSTSIVPWEVAEDDIAALFYTSGTTGLPKGVELTHANLTFQLKTIIEAEIITGQSRVLLPLPLHHVYPFVLGMLAPLALGLCIVMPEAFTGPKILSAMNKGAIDVFIGVPRLYEVLYAGICSQARERGRIPYALFSMCFRMSYWLRHRCGLRAGKVLLRPLHKQLAPQLELVASGGAALDEDLARNLEAIGWKLGEGYGLTETSPLLTLNQPGSAQIGSVGRPIPGIELRVEAPAGQREGEIYARGPSVFRNYHNLPDETRAVFTEDGWFRTGDMGYIDERGYLHLTGRMSTLMVTKGGENVQPDDVEKTYERHATIKEIGVLQEKNRLVAVVVPSGTMVQELGFDDAEAAIREAIREKSKDLPSYQRLSDYVITREGLARTRLGKIQRHLLKARYASIRESEETPTLELQGPLPLEEMSDRDRELMEVEQAAQVWELLATRYQGTRLTPDTYLQLELGVDSLEWMDLALSVHRASGVELSDSQIAHIETVRDLLAEVCEGASSIESTRIPWILEDPESALTDEQRKWLTPLSPVMRAFAHGLYKLNRLFIRTCFHLQIQGKEKLPKEGPLILAPNHCSYLDPFVVAAALDFEQLMRCNWAALRAVVYANPVTRLVCRLAQAVPVDPRQAVLSSLAFGASVLKHNSNLIWFPEGTRSETGELQPFRPGISELIDHFQVPTVPVYIRGTYEALPPGSKRPRFTPIAIVFGDPAAAAELEHAGEGDEPRARITSALYQKVAELGGRIDV